MKMIAQLVLAGCLLAATTMVDGVAGPPSNSLNRASDETEGRGVSADLKAQIVARIESANLEVSDSGDKEITNLVAAAATRFERSRRQEAIENAAKVGEKIVSVARSHETNTVTDSTVLEAKSSLCPLWPFC